MVWRQLPKLVPAGSIPVSCSKPRIRAHLAPFLHVSDFILNRTPSPSAKDSGA